MSLQSDTVNKGLCQYLCLNPILWVCHYSSDKKVNINIRDASTDRLNSCEVISTQFILKLHSHAIPHQGKWLSQSYLSDVNMLCLVKHRLRNSDLCLCPCAITGTLIHQVGIMLLTCMSHKNPQLQWSERKLIGNCLDHWLFVSDTLLGRHFRLWEVEMGSLCSRNW